MSENGPASATPLLVSFVGADTGVWRIDSIAPVIGEGLGTAARLDVIEGSNASPSAGAWTLRGFTSNARYTNGNELKALQARQQGLGRLESTCAALIPIRKTAAWWALGQDERRAIFEEQSRHIAIGLDYLPGVARRLHHSRDLGEPFDFLTWFEYGPDQREAFEVLVQRLRETREWQFVEREVDIRLSREG